MYRQLEELISRGEALKTTFTVVVSDELKFTNDKKIVGKWISDSMSCIAGEGEEIYREFKQWLRKDGTSSEITLQEFEKLIKILEEINPSVYY